MRLQLSAIFGACAVGLVANFAGAISVDSPRAEFFEKKIRPILMDNCYKCHSPAAPKLKGGLNVASREGLLKGGENGPAVVPGNPEKSKLIEAIGYTNKDNQMPPKSQLPPAVIADLTKWVAMGAPWGGGDLKGSVGPSPANYDKLRQTHWAWQPVRPVKVPAVKDNSWPKSDVDHFVLAKLEAQGLHPAAPADKFELLRRVTFDLTGLPPSPQEIDAFTADPSANAYAKVVDRLLASPAFGERWGRHWLDVARYAESTGSTRNYPYDYAWRYRDYVIDAFNNDKPYNQFVAEQIAGDLLPYRSAAQHDEQLIATGFLALGVKDLNEKDRVKYLMDNVDEQIDVTGKAILGMTISCARCHDHKFDPIPQADYYKLAGIFRSTEILSGLSPRRGGGKLRYGGESPLVKLDPLPGPDDKAATQAQIDDLTRQLEEAQTKLKRLGGGLGPRALALQQQQQTGNNRVIAMAKNARLIQINQEVAQLESELAVLRSGSGLAVGVKDSASPSDSPLFEHGEPEAPGPIVQRGGISLCKFVSFPSIPKGQSGRLELARWMASRDNPLTTRVMANRIWHHLFGEGIVRTVDNFGTTGEAPSHPELLDYLAGRFVQEGWSVKKMVRELVMTQTYEMGAAWDAADGAIDPANHLLWRMSPRRMEAEEIRDAVLAIGGNLDTRRPVGSTVMNLPLEELRGFRSTSLMATDSTTTRTIYLPILRDLLPTSLDRFDFANPEMVTGDREVTTVAPQALFLMNDPFVMQQSRRMADRVLGRDLTDQNARVDFASKLAFGRPATVAEKARAAQYLSEYAGDMQRAGSPAPRAGQEAWASLCQAMLASAEFRYVN